MLIACSLFPFVAEIGMQVKFERVLPRFLKLRDLDKDRRRSIAEGKNKRESDKGIQNNKIKKQMYYQWILKHQRVDLSREVDSDFGFLILT